MPASGNKVLGQEKAPNSCLVTNLGVLFLKQESRAGTSNCISVDIVGCNYSFLPLIPASGTTLLNTLRPRQDGRHFADDIFKCIFFNENGCILITFSLKCICKGAIDNNPALVQIMAWRRSGDKPLSEPMMIILTTHICVTRPKWERTGHDYCVEFWTNFPTTTSSFATF